MSNIDEQILELKKLTRTSKNTDLSKALGVSPSTVQTWRSRGKIPEDIFIKANQIAKSGSLAPRGYLELKFFDVEVSAGHGALVEKEEESSAMVFSERFIRQELGFNPNNIFLMPVRGDSMAPTLKNQSIVMVNRMDGFSTDGIYVFRYDNRLMVKRLQFLPHGIKVVSDNSSYEAWELGKKDIEGADFEIIGEVVWSGQRM
ncbi:S24 family peptidase [Vibrio parahaemolyticus]|nr:MULTISPECIES: S24 family peptidase [Vibrio harveyi group]KIT53246.1 transcriptional regulator [Vibrio parahaemolyticus 901128]EGQ8484485.1 transcriptional regulator [Vibrio parahaemolyticus]EGQ9704948.1 transcriptional regulator [Vibrio parahaemolyticus]EGR1688754.1 transcriptional regulator [Vibrio parahaemolyticus]EGR1756781.1 transcriptional regulator [Vibrio parahaemolyticus]